MLTNEIHRLIRNMVEASKESHISQEEVMTAVTQAFSDADSEKNESQNVCVSENSGTFGTIHEFVETKLTKVMCPESQTPVLLKKSEFDFVVKALHIYYVLGKQQAVVDITNWMELVSKETKVVQRRAYPMIHTKLKRCLGEYMGVEWQSRRIDKMMAQFYHEHMKMW